MHCGHWSKKHKRTKQRRYVQPPSDDPWCWIHRIWNNLSWELVGLRGWKGCFVGLSLSLMSPVGVVMGGPELSTMSRLSFGVAITEGDKKVPVWLIGEGVLVSCRSEGHTHRGWGHTGTFALHLLKSTLLLFWMEERQKITQTWQGSSPKSDTNTSGMQGQHVHCWEDQRCLS
jgi:hypothetical protein